MPGRRDSSRAESGAHGDRDARPPGASLATKKTFSGRAVEKKYYAPGIGLIIEENGSERLEIVEIIG